MKFTVEQHALADAVNWVSRSLSNRPIMTALLGIVIEVKEDEVFLTGSDLETSSKVHFSADVSEVGKVLVPGKLLAEISRSLPNKPVTVQLVGSRVLVTSGTAKFTLPTLSLNEYPNLPELPETIGPIDRLDLAWIKIRGQTAAVSWVEAMGIPVPIANLPPLYHVRAQGSNAAAWRPLSQGTNICKKTGI